MCRRFHSSPIRAWCSSPGPACRPRVVSPPIAGAAASGRITAGRNTPVRTPLTRTRARCWISTSSGAAGCWNASRTRATGIWRRCRRGTPPFPSSRRTRTACTSARERARWSSCMGVCGGCAAVFTARRRISRRRLMHGANARTAVPACGRTSPGLAMGWTAKCSRARGG